MLSKKELSLGKILGIEITLDYSWFWIFLIIILSLSLNLFPRIEEGRPYYIYFGLGTLAATLLFLSVIFHEISHTLVARMNKVKIEKITLFLFGGAARLTEELPSAWTEFKMAIVGPITSFVIGGLFLLLMKVTNAINPPLSFLILLETIGILNITLAFFNLLPGFPLDGGRVIRALVWAKTKNLEKATRYATIGGQGIGWALIALGFLQIFSRNFGGIWLILVGFFLIQAAIASYNQTLSYIILNDFKVEQIMRKHFPRVSVGSKLKDLAKLAFETEEKNFSVVKDDKIIGTINSNLVAQVSNDELKQSIGKYINPISRDIVVEPNDSASTALKMMNENMIELLPVVENGKITGMISAQDISKFLTLRVYTK
jgi:Zn-dependent protease/predicted transcriptional regulator